MIHSRPELTRQEAEDVLDRMIPDPSSEITVRIGDLAESLGVKEEDVLKNVHQLRMDQQVTRLRRRLAIFGIGMLVLLFSDPILIPALILLLNTASDMAYWGGHLLGLALIVAHISVLCAIGNYLYKLHDLKERNHP